MMDGRKVHPELRAGDTAWGHARQVEPLGQGTDGYERLPVPQCTGSRCDSDVVLATVTGESNLS